MSFNLQKAVWEYGPNDPTQHHVLLALADYANDDGGGAFPAIETIAQKCRVSRSTAIRALKGLADNGWIVRRRHGQSSNSYVIQVDKLSPQSVIVTHQTEPQSVNMTHQTELQSVKMTLPKYQNDTLQSVKMTPDPIILTNQLTNNDYAPLDQLRDHFANRTITQPNERVGTYERNWSQPLAHMLALAGNDVTAAAALIDAALDVARGKNESGKVYPVASPRSIMTIAANLAASAKASAVAEDDEALWKRAVRAVTRQDYSDERLKAAIRAIGGSGRIASANGKDTEQIRRQLANAYRRIPSPA